MRLLRDSSLKLMKKHFTFFQATTKIKTKNILKSLIKPVAFNIRFTLKTIFHLYNYKKKKNRNKGTFAWVRQKFNTPPLKTDPKKTGIINDGQLFNPWEYESNIHNNYYPGHNILALSNNLAQVQIATSKTILDI